MATQTIEAARRVREPAEPMKPVVDPAAWTGADLTRRTDWRFALTPAEIAELDAAVARVRDRGLDIQNITRADFPLPTLEPKLAALKAQIVDGLGIGLLGGVPVERYTTAEAAAAFWGIGLRVGEPVSQNYKGHVLGHVCDLHGATRDGSTSLRAYHTAGELGYHTDSCDIVVLMCLRQAKSGGGNRLASLVAVYNEMLRRRPDLVAELIKPWYRDRRNEIPPGKGPYFALPIFNFAAGYFSASWQNYYTRSAQRFPELPRFTAAQIEALDMIDTLCDELCYVNKLAPGDVVFLHNHVMAHARDEYEDWPEPARKRHLLRLWLATPGGRPLPDAYLDRYVGLKPGQRPAGIIVDGMKHHAPLEPE